MNVRSVRLIRDSREQLNLVCESLKLNTMNRLINWSVKHIKIYIYDTVET